ncbi:hypothetical protein ACP3TJ_12395 [Desulforudis sp. 1088]|uniref:hypothetical protein n=1 Tax=unclassified Candidatus Desulforudis TaxID=2635950 RepID=UPI00346CD024
MLSPDVVSGMIKLHLMGYLSYDEIVHWADKKFHDLEFIDNTTSDETCDAMFDVLSTIMLGQDEGMRLESRDFEMFLDRLEAV